jgi:hypothetical protein
VPSVRGGADEMTGPPSVLILWPLASPDQADIMVTDGEPKG